MFEELTKQLRLDEGCRSTVYKDSLGLWTIGIGRLVDPSRPKAGLRQVEMEFMLQNDINDRIQALQTKLPWFKELDAARQGVLINMAFQLGTEGLLAFTRTLGLIRNRQFAEASVAMLESKWASQTPERAKRMSRQMLTGEWQYSA